MSVDLYVEQVIDGARCIAIRLLGGLDYWRYGAEEIAHAARAQGIQLALLPGDGRDDVRLAELSTVDGAMLARLDAFFAAGGPQNMRRALDLMAHLAGLAPDHGLFAEPLPMHGEFRLDVADVPGRPLAVIVFYRAYLLAADLAPIDALARALDEKDSMFERFTLPASRIATPATSWRRACATGPRRSCSTPRRSPPASTMRLRRSRLPARRSCKSCSPDRAATPGSTRRVGLSQSDHAMQVVLPELDGRLLTTAISFKAEESEVVGLEFARVAHQPAPAGVAAAARSASLWSHCLPPRRARAQAGASCCRIIRARQGKPPTPWASTPSPAPPRSCSFSSAKASMSAMCCRRRTTRRRSLQTGARSIPLARRLQAPARDSRRRCPRQDRRCLGRA